MRRDLMRAGAEVISNCDLWQAPHAMIDPYRIETPIEATMGAGSHRKLALIAAAALMIAASPTHAQSSNFDGTYAGTQIGTGRCSSENEITLMVIEGKIHSSQYPDRTVPVATDGTFSNLTIPGIQPGNEMYITGHIVDNTITDGEIRASGNGKGCTYRFTAKRLAARGQ